MTDTTAARAFLAQNDLFAKDLTDDDRATVEQYAEHHAGGLMVIERRVSEHLYVKAHDSWGDDGKIVVHTYSPDDIDDEDTVAEFGSGHEALAAFLAVEPDPARAASDTITALLARDEREAFLTAEERKALTDVLAVIA